MYYFGRRIEGKMCRYFGTYSEQKFESIMKELNHNLPKDFVVWHVERKDIDANTKRIQRLREFPFIREYNSLTPSGIGFADARRDLLRAKEIEELE